MNPVTAFVEAGASVLNALQTPNERGLFLHAIMANLVGSMTDEVWNQINKAARPPCGELNCTCHLARQKFFDALEAVRKDWKEEMNHRRSTRRNRGFGAS